MLSKYLLLLHYSNNSFFGNLEYGITGLLNSSSISWTWAEIVEGIPSILNPYKGETINPAKLVTESFLPIDYQNSMLRNAYFNRFLLFAGYHDFGFIGAFLQSFFVGFLYSWFYRRMLRRISKEKLLWPIFVYLPVVYFNIFCNCWRNYLWFYKRVNTCNNDIDASLCNKVFIFFALAKH